MGGDLKNGEGESLDDLVQSGRGECWVGGGGVGLAKTGGLENL